MTFSWKVLKNTLIPDDILSQPDGNSYFQIKSYLDREKLFFASYTSHFDQNEPTDFWYIINDQLLELNEYPSKVRNEIRQSLKRCQIEKINPLNHWEMLFQLYSTAVDSYSHYSFKFRLGQFKDTILSHLDTTDIWLIKDSNDVPIGYGHVIRKSKYVDLFDIKIDPTKTKNLPVFGFLYHLNQFYLSQPEFKFISDGRRSMFHDTNFQAFLEKKFLYRKAYCDLHIIYSSRITKVMFFIRIFGSILSKLPAKGPVRKLNLLFNYDRIAKSVL